jgi:hypothetical protein
MDALKQRPISLQFQKRDFEVLRGLFESRVMTLKHISKLFFEDKCEYTKKRLRKIKAAGLVVERRRRVNERSVLCLTPKALTVLEAEGILAEYPWRSAVSSSSRANVSDITLAHELEVMDVRAAFQSAIRQVANFGIAEFSTWPALYEFETTQGTFEKPRSVKPDGFIRIHEHRIQGNLSKHTFFLELDRSTKDLGRLVQQASCYLQYYRTGGFALRNGASLSDAKDYPFRVLFVLKTAERRNNLAERLLLANPPIFTQVCLSTFAEVTANPLAAIWFSPIHYRDVTRGTPFQPGQSRKDWGYRRQTMREAFVEQNVRKMSILFENPEPPFIPDKPQQISQNLDPESSANLPKPLGQWDSRRRLARLVEDPPNSQTRPL